MKLEPNASNICDLFLYSKHTLPIAFATWIEQSDNIFISKKLGSILKTTKGSLKAYDFVKLMKNNFGDFLNIAVEKISDINFNYNNYTSIIKSSFNSEFELNLDFDPISKVYLLIIKEIDNSNKNISELESIVNSLPVYIWQQNKNLQITYCNKKYSDALETSQESVISQNIKLFTQEKKDSSYADKNLYSTKIKKVNEHVIINGERRLLEIQETPFLGGNKSIGCAIDITEQENIQKDYKSYKKQTEKTLNNISVPIAIFDEKTNLIFANDSFIKLFEVDNFIVRNSKNFSEILDIFLNNDTILSLESISEFKEKANSLFTKVLDDIYHTTINIKNEKTMYVTVTPNHVGGLIFLFEDISDKIALEREVNSISAVQQETLNHLTEGVIVFGNDNRIKITNPAINQIWDKKNETKASGIHIRDFFEDSIHLFKSEQDVELWISKLVNLASKRIEASDTINLKFQKSIEYSYVPLPDGLNLVRFYDISDKTNLERELKDKTEKVSQIDKLKKNLLSNISYELMSPLNTVKGFVEILIKQYFGELNNKQLRYCDGISNAIDRLTEIVDAIINLESIKAGQMKLQYTNVNLLNFIKNIISLFESRSKLQKVKLKTNIDDPSITVSFDEKAIEQAIFQIISKSFKLTPSGGEISIFVDFPVDNPDYFELSILDNGMGISERELEKSKIMLEDRAIETSVDKTIEFGLILANNIIKLHNGSIKIDSKEGEGTSITFILPRSQFLI